ncbi:MAG: hypothetical protein KDC53_23190 [Saprospiraceae bacterium]|nr:hypothetical protein [Saprospiraceae bacterium]
MKSILTILMLLVSFVVKSQTIQRPYTLSGEGHLGEEVFQLGSYEELERPSGEVSELNYGRLRLTEIQLGQPGNNLHFRNWDIIAGNNGLEFQVDQNLVGYINGIDGQYHDISDKSRKTNILPYTGVLV